MMTRRFFVKASGLALLSFGGAPSLLARIASAGTGGGKRRTLVVVFQRGACDGLNVVVPYGEHAYRELRPSIAIPPPGGGRGGCLDLDGFFGLHPALEPLLPFWRDQTLGAVQAVGSPDSTRSHFDAQDFMESGTPGRKATEDGWMNRCLQAEPELGATPFRAVAMTAALPRSLAGRAPAVALANLQSFGLKPSAGAAVARGFEDMYEGAVQDVVHGTGREALEAVDFLKRSDPARYLPRQGVEYPAGAYGRSLKQAAQLVKADVGLELAFTEIGGWDHHAGEGGAQGQLAGRLRELGAALAAFRKDLDDRMQDVVVVTMTEFGRTARENGNRGTDHGHASCSLVMGGRVRGGRVHGRWPGLAPDQLYEGRDLALTTDFRDLLAELVGGHLGVRDLRPVFPGHIVGRGPGVLRS